MPHDSQVPGDGQNDPSKPDIARDATIRASQRSRPDTTEPSRGIDHGRFVPGTKLGERYRIVGLLGQGGMGEVYRADDLELGQSVALKFLPERVADNPAWLARFRNEVRTAREIAHPNVCRMYDIGEQDGHIFLTMEYVDGEDLGRVLRRMGRPSRDKGMEIARQICLGLAAAHENGILHRDLKPANIMIDGRGRVRITDFGLAGFLDEVEGKESRAGTPAYMAPEQLDHGRVSVRSDVYALGLVLYELFTGKCVFDTDDVTEIRRKQSETSLTNPSSFNDEMDPAVEQVIMRCLEPEPERRPSSVYAVLGALPGGDPLAAAIAAGETPSPELVASAGEQGALRPRAAIAMLALAVVCTGVAFGIVRGRTIMPPTAPAVLSARAGQLLDELGYPERPRYSADGMAADNADTLAAQDEDDPAVTASRLRNPRSPQPRFWRRWSPDQMKPADFHVTTVGMRDPPPHARAETLVVLDGRGRLLELAAIEDPAWPAVEAGPDWAPLFAAAELDRTQFTETVPESLPAVPCDDVVAWRGSVDADGETWPVEVRAAAARGRPVSFLLRYFPEDADVETAAPPPGPPAGGVMGFVFVVLFAGVHVVAVVLAWRNVRRGRCDRRGAFRLGMAMFACYYLVELTGVRPGGPLLYEFIGGRPVAHALLHGFTVWIMYLAIEPFVRRLWPHMLVSWTRMLSGRFRDPLVGRDVLLGVAAGAAMWAFLGVVLGVQVWMGEPIPPSIGTGAGQGGLTGLRAIVTILVGDVSAALLQSTLALTALLVLRLLLGRTWLVIGIALGLPVLVILAGPAPTMSMRLIGATLALGWVGAVLFLLFRFGLFVVVVAIYVVTTLTNAPLTMDTQAWYFGTSTTVLLALGALAAYGFHVSLAGQQVLRDVMGE